MGISVVGLCKFSVGKGVLEQGAEKNIWTWEREMR